MPAFAFPRRPVAELLSTAHAGLAEAARVPGPAERYALAHLAALRCAAAMLAARAHPGGHRRGPTSAWVLLAAVAPELGEWAAFFASGAAKRAAAESGHAGAVTAREADDLVRDARAFLELVEAAVAGCRPGVPLPILG